MAPSSSDTTIRANLPCPAPEERLCQRDQTLLVGPGSQADERPLHYLLKNPEHSQAYGKTKNKNPFKAMAEVAAGSQVEKVAKIRGQTSNHQGRKHQISPQRQDRGRMSKREGQVPMLPQVPGIRKKWAALVPENQLLGCDLLN